MNIYIKSTLRRPIRNLLLALLLGIASFTIVFRFAEHTIIENEIHRIEGFYRAIGYLRGPNAVQGRIDVGNNVVEGANVVAKSPYVTFVDHRRWAVGALHEIKNLNASRWGWVMNTTIGPPINTMPSVFSTVK